MWQDQITKSWSIECMKPKYNEPKMKRKNFGGGWGGLQQQKDKTKT